MEKFPTTSILGTRKLIALALALATLNLPATVALGSPSHSPALGTLSVNGVVTVNDVRALSSQIIFSSSHIVTASKAYSTLDLGNFTRLTLAEETELALDFSAASISGSLQRGELRAFMPAARALNLNTPGGVIATDSSQPAVFKVQIDADFTRISVEKGQIELRAGNSKKLLTAGETFSLGRESLPATAPQRNLNKAERGGIIAGIGAGVAILLIAIIGGDEDNDDMFGGCAIILSPIDGNPPPCF